MRIKYIIFFGWIELPKSRKEEKERKETDKFTMKPYTLKTISRHQHLLLNQKGLILCINLMIAIH